MRPRPAFGVTVALVILAGAVAGCAGPGPDAGSAPPSAPGSASVPGVSAPASAQGPGDQRPLAGMPSLTQAQDAGLLADLAAPQAPSASVPDAGTMAALAALQEYASTDRFTAVLLQAGTQAESPAAQGLTAGQDAAADGPRLLDVTDGLVTDAGPAPLVFTSEAAFDLWEVDPAVIDQALTPTTRAVIIGVLPPGSEAAGQLGFSLWEQEPGGAPVGSFFTLTGQPVAAPQTQ